MSTNEIREELPMRRVVLFDTHKIQAKDGHRLLLMAVMGVNLIEVMMHRRDQMQTICTT